MTAAPLDHGVSEFDVAGLTPVPDRHVAVPRVGESRAAMECKVIEVSQLTNARGEKVERWFVPGEVVAVYIDESLTQDGVYNTARGPRWGLLRGHDGKYVRNEASAWQRRPEFHGA